MERNNNNLKSNKKKGNGNVCNDVDGDRGNLGVVIK